MKNKYLKLLSLCFLLSSCKENYIGKPAPGVDGVSQPSHVCDFSDGRVLYRIVVQENGMKHDHYVYFFKNKNDASVVSINRSVSSGKTTTNMTIVQIPE